MIALLVDKSGDEFENDDVLTEDKTLANLDSTITHTNIH
jgi:hypothetical protein